MRDIPTFTYSEDTGTDLKAMHGFLELYKTHMINAEIKLDAILVTEREYHHFYYNDTVISPNDFSVRRRVIASKIIGIHQIDGTVRVVDTVGNDIKLLKSPEEFSEEYFVDLI